MQSNTKDEFGRGELVHENGLELINFSDDYVHKNTSTEYILENVIFEPSAEVKKSVEYIQLQDLLNSMFTNLCQCSGSDKCISQTSCSHGGNYLIEPNNNEGGKELVLNSSRYSKDLIYECYETCQCSKNCLNRLVQFGPRNNLQIVSVNYLDNQYGVITTKKIPNGGFICEYAGEILTKSEAERRHLDNIKNKSNNYIVCLNERSLLNESTCIQTFIDPSKKGNIGRYLNHSCEPNCEIISVRIGCPVPKLGIFANRLINQGEELCFHYGGDKNKTSIEMNLCGHDRRKRCFCGAKNCNGFLPNLSF